MDARRGAVLAAGIACLVAATPAGAETDTTSVTITGGSLSYTTPLVAGDFPNVTLNGLTQVVKANIAAYAVTDARGSDSGWNLTVDATQFANADGDKLPAGSLRMVDVPVPVPGVSLAGLVPPTPAVPVNPIDGGGGAQKIASALAAPLTGTGQWTFTPTTGALVLSVPPTALPGTYTSTITTTLATGP